MSWFSMLTISGGGADAILTNGIGFILFGDVLILYPENIRLSNQEITLFEGSDDLDFGTIQSLKILYNY